MLNGRQQSQNRLANVLRECGPRGEEPREVLVLRRRHSRGRFGRLGVCGGLPPPSRISGSVPTAAAISCMVKRVYVLIVSLMSLCRASCCAMAGIG